jgi:hypothetical protein
MARFRFILSSILLLLPVPGTLAGQENFTARSHDFGLSAGFLFEGSAYFAEADDEFVAGDGLGLNLGVEFQYDMGFAFMPFAEVGFLSQPWGGNEDTDITYDPILYPQIGIAL